MTGDMSDPIRRMPAIARLACVRSAASSQTRESGNPAEGSCEVPGLRPRV